MADPDPLAELMKGVDAWNVWRSENPDVEPDLIGASLSGADLSGADLRGTDLYRANLRRANLREAKLGGAFLGGANLRRANLREANLGGADLSAANLREAKLGGANLTYATLVHTDLRGAELTGCHIYGVSAWDLRLEGAKQENLIITPEGAPEVTVDDLEVGQFVYLLLHNEKIRDVIDTIGKKGVLLLGRFTDERKAILDALREELRKHDYLPILFDFDVPATRDITETVSLLARMARFIIADMTDPSSIPKELEAIVPHLAVPVQPLLQDASRPYACSRTIGNTTGYFHRTDTRDWRRCSQVSRRTSLPLRKRR
jgi:Pentapeptide repeats (8 copies)